MILPSWPVKRRQLEQTTMVDLTCQSLQFIPSMTRLQSVYSLMEWCCADLPPIHRWISVLFNKRRHDVTRRQFSSQWLVALHFARSLQVCINLIYLISHVTWACLDPCIKVPTRAVAFHSVNINDCYSSQLHRVDSIIVFDSCYNIVFVEEEEQ